MKAIRYLLLLLVVTVPLQSSAFDLLAPTMTFCVTTDDGDPNNRNAMSDGGCGGAEGKITVRLPYKGTDTETAQEFDPTKVKKGIIVIHGLSFNGKSIFSAVYTDIKDIALLTTEEAQEVWLVSPQFLPGDYATENATLLKWYSPDDDPNTDDYYGYPMGNLSVSPPGSMVSSFDVLDNIILKMKKRAPGIKEIIIAGHSAGGQFVNRYSAATQIESHAELSGVEFRYIISAPGSYMYFSGNRYDSSLNSPTGKLTPAAATVSCDGYDDYRFGTNGIEDGHYLDHGDDTQNNTFLRENVAQKKRLFLVGDGDVGSDPDGENPDESDCGVAVQGKHRVQRAYHYLAHLREEGLAKNTGLCIVKGLAHQVGVLGRSVAVIYWRDDAIDCKTGNITNSVE